MTEQQHHEEIEALAKRFSELSYQFAPQDEVMKAFEDWWEAKDKLGVTVKVKRGYGSTVTNNEYDKQLHNLK